MRLHQCMYLSHLSLRGHNTPGIPQPARRMRVRVHIYLPNIPMQVRTEMGQRVGA